jgi:hypothetical protein
MRTNQTDPKTIADKHLNNAMRSLSEFLATTGRKRIEVVCEVEQDVPAPNLVTEPSHRPARHLDDRFGIKPAPFDLRERAIIAAASSAARAWSRENNFSPPLHDTPPDHVAWKIVHHDDCPLASRTICDCGTLVLARFACQAFAVSMDGRIEPYTQPAPIISDLEGGGHKYQDSACWTREESSKLFDRLSWGFWFQPVAFVICGEGDTARVVGKVGVGPTQDFLDAERRRRVSEP